MFGRLFCSAFQFMTILPIKKDFGLDEKSFASISFFFPVTGLFVGFVAAMALYVFLLLDLAVVGAVCAVLVEMLLTGGLHTDGLSDMCDAFGARKTREKTLEIMKDSRVGAFGVISIVLNLGLRFALIYALASGSFGLISVFMVMITPSLSKTAMVMCAALGDYPREQGTGKTFIENIRPNHVAVTAVIAGVIAFLFSGWIISVICTGAMLLAGFIIKMISDNKIGGVTGDILGASNEIGEITVLFIMVITEALI